MEAKPNDVPAKYSPGFIEAMDGRKAVTREMQARFREICADLGGHDRLSYMARSLVERYVFLDYWLSQQERDLADGADFDVSRWIQAANAANGLATKLGLERKAASVPSLTEYLQRREAQA